MLFASRIVSALACAGFWAVGAAVAIAMVPVTSRARALAVMIGGLSIANVLGVPAGAFLGEHLGWRSAFWAVGAASAIALVGVVTLIPRIPLPDKKPQLRREVSIYGDAQVWLTVALVMLAAGGSSARSAISRRCSRMSPGSTTAGCRACSRSSGSGR